VKPGSPWGVSEKHSESCKGNFAGTGSGSMGMRRDELANSSISVEEEEEGKEVKANFNNPFNGGKVRRPEGHEATFFWVSQSATFRKILFAKIENPKGEIPLKSEGQCPYLFLRFRRKFSPLNSLIITFCY
jgi:hypothetical protein